MSKTDLEPLMRQEGTSDALKSILDAASAHEPSAADLAGLQAKLAAVLPAGALPLASTGGAVAAKAAKGAVITKIVLGVMITTGVLSTAWIATRHEVPPAPAPSVMPTAEPSKPTEAPAEPARTVDSLPNAEPSAHPSAKVDIPRPPTRESAVAEPEAKILAEAHEALLRGAPDRALSRANDHARSHPSGALAQEREVIAIEALIALGRRAEAVQRAKAFRARYPGSTHLEKIDRLVPDR